MPRRARRPQAPADRAVPDRLPRLHGRGGARVRRRARRDVHRRHGRAHGRPARQPNAARTAGRSIRTSSRPRTASWRRSRSWRRGPARRSSGSRSTTASCCTGSTTRGSCRTPSSSCRPPARRGPVRDPRRGRREGDRRGKPPRASSFDRRHRRVESSELVVPVTRPRRWRWTAPATGLRNVALAPLYRSHAPAAEQVRARRDRITSP